MAITSNVLVTTGNVIYTSTNNSVVSVMYFCNTDSTYARNINVYLVSSGGTAGSATQIYKDIQIAPKDTFVVDMEKLVLGNGDFISADVSANASVTSTVSYVGI